MKHKILVSPNFGAGWSTWVYGSKAARVFALTYEPIITHIEEHGLPVPEEMLKEYQRVMDRKYSDSPYIGGAQDLVVVEVDCPFYINEYDGSESVVLQNDTNLFIDLDKELS